MEAFIRDDVLPSWFANALGRALSVLVQQFELVLLDNTHVQVPAGANDQAAVISIGGLWRWSEASLTVAHPGGAAGSYPIFVTAAANDIRNVPQPYTDDTNYSFALSIRAPGGTPPIVAGVVDVYRHVGDAIWDGAKIVRVEQLVPLSPLHAHRHALGGPDPLSLTDINAVAADDPRLTNSRAPSGAAGGDLAGSNYPNPRVDPTWTPFAPVIAADGGGGAADGASTLVGRYKVLGDVCFFYFQYDVHAGGGFSAGFGAVSFALPLPAIDVVRQVVPCLLWTPTDANWWQGIGRIIPGQAAVHPMFPVAVAGAGWTNSIALDGLSNGPDAGHIGNPSVPELGGLALPLMEGSSVIVSGHYRVA